MWFEFNDEELAFREELREFLDDELPDGWIGPNDESSDEGWALYKRMRKALADRGWLTMTWPKEYGGQEASPMISLIFAEEMSYRRAPGNDRFGTRMLGPTLMHFGTEEQKRKYLPDIAQGGLQWCQGYSEPNTGSDLASLQTFAELRGDEFVINGSKIWTSLAHRADMMFMLVRTDREAERHSGITFLLVDMKSPGIQVNPIINIAGAHSFNQVMFDDVHVPIENMVGELNDGWNVAMNLLNFERGNIDYVSWAQRSWEEIRDYAATTRRFDGSLMIDDMKVRRRLAELEAEIEMARYITYEVAWLQTQGYPPSTEASMCKIAATEANCAVLDFGVELLGMPGLIDDPDEHEDLAGRIFKMRMYQTSGPILAGTNEIQKNIIAYRGLELPRR